jgi:hypothetical protein
MSPARSVHRSAAALLAANFGIGLLPFVLLAGFHPAIRWHCAFPLAISFAAALLVSWFIAPDRRVLWLPGVPLARRLPACLLLGASLAAILWKQQDFPLAAMVISLGFGLRWLLFALESLELHRADQRRLPLPCAATRIRRGCTMITGAFIPLLLLAGFPCLPLLWISFILTLFCQWTIGGESCHALANHRFTSSLRPQFMNITHESDGGIY